MNPSSHKADGTLYEQIFIAKSMSMGLHPHPTIGDYLPHDVIILNDAGRSFRVQVKGTGAPRKGHTKESCIRYEVTIGTGRNKQPMDCTKVDVIAALVKPLDTWYLIPCVSIPGNRQSIKFYPHTPGGSKSHSEQFKENWSVFHQI